MSHRARRFDGVSMEAIHEAGHAVLAAHLRIPFRSVTIRPSKRDNSGGHVTLQGGALASVHEYSWNHRTDLLNRRSDQEIKREVERQITNKAIMTLAARAAVDTYDCWSGQIPEEVYAGDEQGLRTYAGYLKVPAGDFALWREALLNRAREIVLVPYVKETIWLVACNLEAEYTLFRRGIAAIGVREYLRAAKRAHIGQEHAQ